MALDNKQEYWIHELDICCIGFVQIWRSDFPRFAAEYFLSEQIYVPVMAELLSYKYNYSR